MSTTAASIIAPSFSPKAIDFVQLRANLFPRSVGIVLDHDLLLLLQENVSQPMHQGIDLIVVRSLREGSALLDQIIPPAAVAWQVYFSCLYES